MSHVIESLHDQLAAVIVSCVVAGCALGTSLALLVRLRLMQRELDKLAKEVAEFALSATRWIMDHGKIHTDA